MNPGTQELLRLAEEARSHAYCPYSGYAVGAALRTADGRTFAGCNVENVSYGVTICAERSALCALVAAGGRVVEEIVVVTKDGGTPCGVCLQALMEFAQDPAVLAITCASASGDHQTWTLKDLFPMGFKSDSVVRHESGL